MWHLTDIPTAPAFVRYWSKSGHGWILARSGLVANDAVDGARSAASKCYDVVALKREQFKEVRLLPGRGRDDMS